MQDTIIKYYVTERIGLKSNRAKREYEAEIKKAEKERKLFEKAIEEAKKQLGLVSSEELKRQLILGHICTLLLGGLTYTLFRASSLLMFDWYNRIGLLNPINKLREYSNPIANDIPHWFLYSLPDGLWIFSYISLMLFVWKNSISSKNIFWIFIIPILAIGSEIGQLLNFISGTFDFADLVFYILGMTFPFLFYHKSINYKFQFYSQKQ